ncbi:MAG TPA: M15 family metallopeptidase, partial [Casimicrobiaceae bacterium]|nr:M15 family metallopeptidase [Casimicrobiaceae bacterium]
MNSVLQARADAVNAKLGIRASVVRRRKLPLCPDADKLVVVEIGERGRKHRLTPAAARAWKRMKAAAREDGIRLAIVSAFRSFERQVGIIQRKIAEGQSVRQILAFSAPPGYSEHHTGCAVDIGTEGCDELEEIFEASAAFAWLRKNASRFGYFMSYPRGNKHGYR